MIYPNAAGLEQPVLLCLSHLRWDFVFQRPQHLMTRAAAQYGVVFVEEPVGVAATAEPGMAVRAVEPNLVVATPQLPEGLDPAAADAVQRKLLDDLLDRFGGPLDTVWYYTPMAFAFAGHLRPRTVVFDSMDQLSAFDGASPRLELLERQLLRRADIVFAGGRSLFGAKRRLHPNVHLFPSSVDEAHFRAARKRTRTEQGPADQVALPRPRIGYFGVIDERIDYKLLDGVASMRPDWQFVMVGPTAKIDPASLPSQPNLHWLGMKSYEELPSYLSGWDAGLMPFALNEATRFISPTKTPEFLAAGVPLVSTAVPDVVAEWQSGGLVAIADCPEAAVALLEKALVGRTAAWQAAVDQHIRWMSWDTTWARMRRLMTEAATDSPVEAAALPAGDSP